jgi:hypothetical protein
MAGGGKNLSQDPQSIGIDGPLAAGGLDLRKADCNWPATKSRSASRSTTDWELSLPACLGFSSATAIENSKVRAPDSAR